MALNNFIYIYRFGLVSLFNGLSTFVGYLMPSPYIYIYIYIYIYKELALNNFIYIYIYRFGLVSLFNGLSPFVGYLMPKPFSQKNSSGTIKPIG